MADSPQHRGLEKVSHSTSPEGQERKEEPSISGASEVKKGTAEIVTAAETKEGKEGAVEFSEGKVSEQVSEDKKKGPQGAGGASLTTDEIEAIRAKLLANLPPLKEMQRQIAAKLTGEEKKLNKQYRSAKRQGVKAAYQLNNIVARLRKVSEYFALLANATFEVIKQLWLKIVHGV